MIVGAVTGANTVQGQTYTLKFKEAGKSDAVRVKNTEQSDLKIRVVDNNNNVHENKTEKKAEVFDYIESIVDKPAGTRVATKLTRKYQTAEYVEDGNKTTLPYSGKTVLIEKKNGKFRFHIACGEEITGKDAEQLDEEFNKTDFKSLDPALFLPKNAVAINETWKMDAGPILKVLAKEQKMEFDAAKSVMTGKLLRACKKDGRQFGVIEFKLDIGLLSMTEEGAKINVKGSKLIVQGQIDGCIDGTLEYGVMKGTL